MRWVVVLVRVVALGTIIFILVSRARCASAGEACLGDRMFSYFTVHSILLLSLGLLLSAGSAAVTGAEPKWLTAFRALGTTYVVVAGAVFAALLANARLLEYLFVVPLSSKILHFVLPLYALADFLLGPYRHRLSWRTAWWSLVFPALWAAYTLIRGEMSGWYPYFFLDPAQVGGYRVVAVYAVGLTGIILAAAFLAVAATRLPAVPASTGPMSAAAGRPGG